MVRFNYFENFLNKTLFISESLKFEEYYKIHYNRDLNKLINILNKILEDDPIKIYSKLSNTLSSINVFSNLWFNKDEEKCEYFINTLYDFYTEFSEVLEHSNNRNECDQLIKGYTKILFNKFNNNEWNAIPSIVFTELSAKLCPKWYYISSSQIQYVIGLKNIINPNTIKIYIENCKELINYCEENDIIYKNNLLRINYLLQYIKAKK